MLQESTYNDYSILFVDDEEKALKYFNKAVSDRFHVLTASNTTEAKSILENHSDDIGVLITDQRMPGGNGAQLLSKTRKQHPNIIRLLTTAYASQDNVIEAINDGEIFRYITKPWDIKSLLNDLTGAMKLFLSRKRERDILEEKLDITLSVARNIVHELRTPLASIQSAASGLERYLPILLEAYNNALQGNQEISDIRPSHLKTLSTITDNIKDEIFKTNTIIDLLLAIKADGKISSSPSSSEHSINECIIAALSRYPFKKEQRKKIRFIPSDDFQFLGSDLLIIHVFFNLIKNALNAISIVRKGEIIIQIKSDEMANYVHFLDNGPGISKVALPEIFNPFYNPNKAGNGIGLPFCKEVLESFGGDIHCYSNDGSYTEFILRLPHIQT